MHTTLFLGLFICLILPLLSCASTSIEKKPHHLQNGFINPEVKNHLGFWDFIQWQWNRPKQKNPEDYRFPLFTLSKKQLIDFPKPSITWIGHATFYIQTKNFSFLTDPHFSNRASPVSWAGPKRVVPPPIQIEDLPQLDFVLISHSHYDHLDFESIKRISTTFPQVRIYVGLNLKKWFNRHFPNLNIIELDWWEKSSLNNAIITATPIQHWSKRSLWDTNKTLWCGYHVQIDELTLFFAGDTGYSKQFKKIAHRLAPIQVALLPIGAYSPRWFMKNHHINPEEALQIHKDLKTKHSIAMHWGTFILSDEPLDEPPEVLNTLLKNNETISFTVLSHGQSLHFNSNNNLNLISH